VYTQMLAAASHVRVAGHQVIDGVPTTRYTGTLTAAAALTRIPSIHMLVTSARFSVWIDRQHQVRKEIVYEKGTAEQVTATFAVTSINQPVRVTLPPASQVATISASALNGGGLGGTP
jgi:hypothetical protein